ncbi:MAG: ATP-binding protein [Turicibacter sp.]|nr:ATP-binding protein [Turicibacter sp.]
MIKREAYIKRIEPTIDTEFIKIITGVRRSGKSFLLMMIKDLLISKGVEEHQIVCLNFEHPDNYSLQSSEDLYVFLKEKVNENKRSYFLFDEIQEVAGWQKLINGLRVAFDSDIYLTGSNASLLSGEMATYLTGRYIEIKVLPLSFEEYLIFKNYEKFQGERYFREYLEYGGFPSAVLQNDTQLKKDVLSGIYNSILFRDVSSRAIVREPELLERIAIFLLDNVGQLITTNKIANTIRSTGRKVSNNTIENYLSLLADSFLFYKVRRYDIRGKEYLSNQAKYYAVDLGFVLSQVKKVSSNRGSRIENLVFLELTRRGYDVFVGKYDTKEIDFVAMKPEETLYIQVTEQIPETSNRETDNLLHLPTGHKKLVITTSWDDVGEHEGIPIVHISDFLLDI